VPETKKACIQRPQSNSNFNSLDFFVGSSTHHSNDKNGTSLIPYSGRKNLGFFLRTLVLDGKHHFMQKSALNLDTKKLNRF